jgi:hypothetical protein
MSDVLKIEPGQVWRRGDIQRTVFEVNSQNEVDYGEVSRKTQRFEAGLMPLSEFANWAALATCAICRSAQPTRGEV